MTVNKSIFKYQNGEWTVLHQFDKSPSVLKIHSSGDIYCAINGSKIIKLEQKNLQN